MFRLDTVMSVTNYDNFSLCKAVQFIETEKCSILKARVL
jgi:hypothetical protein